MKNKTQELIKILKEKPDRELIFMYPEEGSDHPYTMGYPTQILVDEYYVDDERVYIYNPDIDELIDKVADNIFDDMYPKQSYATDEQNKEILKKAEKEVESYDWKKAIIVYISY